MRKIHRTFLDQSKEAEEIRQGLMRFNSTYRKRIPRGEITLTFKNDDGKVIAGLAGLYDWGWFFIKNLWVSEEYRKQGLGEKLMKAAEKEALKKKCHHLWLDTFSFQAPGFYKKLGFKQFGKLQGFPKGHARYFMMKACSKKSLHQR